MRLNDIQKIIDKATPGPWTAFIPGDNRLVQKALISGPKQYMGNGLGIEDAEFIVMARTLMPILLEIAECASVIETPPEISSGTTMQLWIEYRYHNLYAAFKKLEAL